MARVLVIDDDELVRQTLRRMLEKGGHEVVTAINGRYGLSRFEDDGGIDLVVTDILMPEMEGLETVRSLRQLSPGLPILVITGDPSGGNWVGTGPPPDYLRMAQLLGASGTLRKPFTGPQLLAAIAACLPPP
ncbi:MAG: response regulator [Dongiaceae bacterium]